jgi:hypothetical protein
MTIRQMLLGGASRAMLAPENDEGFEELDDVAGATDEGEEEFDDQDEDQELDEDQVEDELGEEDDEPPAPAPRTRGENRVAAATRAAKEAKAEAAETKRQLAELQQRINAPRQETPEQFRERIASMDQVQFAEFILQQQAATNQQLQFQAQESADKTAYEALAARSPVAAKFRDDVEARLAQMRAGGTTAPRETILRWVIGDRALANAGRATGKAKRAADTNRERNTARPPAGRGDTAASNARGANSASARDKRLENFNI